MDIDHLILLIGTNPVPNYVAAKHFLDGLKSITAVYSRDTFHIAQRLATVLKKRSEALDYRLCGISDPGHAIKIQEEIGSLTFDRKEHVHLNYTGGTKNMAVHVYRTLAAQQQLGKISKISFSYLDARDFKIKFDDGRSSTADLRREIKITINDLLSLHGCVQPDEKYKGKRDEDTRPDWSKANAALRRLILKNQIYDFVLWKNQKIRKFFYDDNDRLRKPKFLSEAELKKSEDGIRTFPEEVHPFHNYAMEVIDAFPPKQAWHFTKDGYLEIPDSETAFKRKEGEFVKGILYLDGGWLEDHVFQVLLEKIDEEGLSFYLYRNCQVKKEHSSKDFEIDVVILNGYQLCGISITTTLKESLCKSKAFEILHRSQQMGGEEARSVLVTALKPDTALRIQEDLAVDTGGQPHLRVLGEDSLAPKKLWEAIKQHILGE
jgi:hypothetical protein